MIRFSDCQTCRGAGYMYHGGEEPSQCPDSCVRGKRPDDSVVEAAARWAHQEMTRRSGVKLTWEAAYPEEQADFMRIAEQMLLAAARQQAVPVGGEG